MEPERWQRLRELFEAAVGLGPAERSSYLERACGGDAELRREVEALLRQEMKSGDSLRNAVWKATHEAQAGPVARQLAEGEQIGK